MNFFAQNWIYLVGFELAIVLFIVCLVLLGHARGQRKLIEALENKVRSQRDAMRVTRATFEALKNEVQSLRAAANRPYSDVVQEQLDVTRNRHVSLSPDRDIVLDITSDTPPARQVLALRHAFLIAEQESALAADNKGIDWEVLEAKLGQILDFYQQSLGAEPEIEVDTEFDLEPADVVAEVADDDTLAQQQRHIANLEKFRQLYFDVERQWREARAEAERYQQELLAMSEGLGAGDEFSALLRQYTDVYAGLDGLMEGGGRETADAALERPSVGHLVIANQEEIQRLRNMAVDQHKIITELKRQLLEADSLEAKDRLIGEMNAQLDRNQRFLKEADTCIQQLETEISQLHAEVEGLKQRLRAAPDADGSDMAVEGDEELDLLRNLVTSFTQQSRDMLAAIAVLEEDNRKLMEQGGKPAANTDDLNSRLAQSQSELLKLQTQYLELEERYLELKMQAN